MKLSAIATLSHPDPGLGPPRVSQDINSQSRAEFVYWTVRCIPTSALLMSKILDVRRNGLMGGFCSTDERIHPSQDREYGEDK